MVSVDHVGNQLSKSSSDNNHVKGLLVIAHLLTSTYDENEKKENF
jgi:hypothetical protein